VARGNGGRARDSHSCNTFTRTYSNPPWQERVKLLHPSLASFRAVSGTTGVQNLSRLLW
jgi:hypothetical protein